MWDRDIPPPTKAPRWDFASAEIGCSVAFGSVKEANKFAGALRKWARANGKEWGALQKQSGAEWRVWVVERKERRGKPTVVGFSLVMHKEVVSYAPLPPAFIDETSEPSTETDDDIMLSVDTRKSAGVTIGKQPEPQPVEVVDEITPTGRRKRKGKEG